jgi:outer membrane protein assembly factor BamA
MIFFFGSAIGYSQERKNVGLLQVGDISISGNKTTKEYIIERELEFDTNDTLSISRLNYLIERSQDNVFNLGLFNSVVISPQIDSSRVNFNVTVTERWYVWPFLILENADRNFNTWWQDKDFGRLSYGIFLDWRNFRGRNENLRFTFKTGFEQALGTEYDIPFLNKKRTLGLKIGAGYRMNKEVNYAGVNNERVFLSNENEALQERYFANVRLTYRRNLYLRQEFTAGFSAVHASDSLTSVATDFLKNNANFSSQIFLSYLLKYDKRDYMDYPLKGSVAEFYAVKQGIGLLNSNDLNILEASVSVRNHVKLGKRLYAANGITGKANLLDDPPYAFQQGLGYNNNFIRGFELYIMDAQHYIHNKTNLKWELIKPASKKIEVIPAEKFNTITYALYLNAFCDVGYAFDHLYAAVNPLSNELLVGYGLGADVVTYYDIVFRMEYAFTNNGDQGLYLHFKKSI